MLNSVARYLWGSSSADHEHEYTDKTVLEQGHDTAEHLDTQQEEDWVVVGAVDKENKELPDSNHPHPLSHSHHHLHHHHHSHFQPPVSTEEQDSLSQTSSSASDTELLEDAVSLALRSNAIYRGVSRRPQHSRPDSPYPVSDYHPLQDCQFINHDSDYSDTESQPDSVFSACSGRSHATYHPHGTRSEPWVVAPSPCFIDYNLVLNTVPSNPLENLLIEHPSMSVYLSIPTSSLPSSYPFLSTRLTGAPPASRPDVLVEGGDACVQEVQDDSVSGDQQIPNAVQAEIRFAPPVLASSQQLSARERISQRIQCQNAQKYISHRKCERQNKVREYQGYPKGGNRRSKRTRPSGVKSSRYNQRM